MVGGFEAFLVSKSKKYLNFVSEHLNINRKTNQYYGIRTSKR